MLAPPGIKPGPLEARIHLNKKTKKYQRSSYFTTSGVANICAPYTMCIAMTKVLHRQKYSDEV